MNKEVNSNESPLMPELRMIQHDFLDKADPLYRNDVHNTIVFFGSARLENPIEARRNLLALETRYAQTAEVPPMKYEEALSRQKAKVELAHYFTEAEELAYRLAKWSSEYMITTGGGPGIMHAGNQGAHRAGCKNVGLNINIASEQSHNTHITPELKLQCETFYARKYWFFAYMRACVVFPGGLGTCDELFELLNMMATEKLDFDGPIVLFGEEFWRKSINFEYMIQSALVYPVVRDYFIYTSSVETAFKYITERLPVKPEGPKYNFPKQ